MLSWIGWVATAAFAASYLCRQPTTLRRVQAAAAVLWVVYGLLIHAAPVVVANLIVATLALGSSLKSWTLSGTSTELAAPELPRARRTCAFPDGRAPRSTAARTGPHRPPGATTRE